MVELWRGFGYAGVELEWKGRDEKEILCKNIIAEYTLGFEIFKGVL